MRPEARRGITLKRSFDIASSIVGLILLWPAFLVIAVLIKLDSPGPVFYRGERVGKDGKLFRIYKFRTMVAYAERLGPPITLRGDSRVTRLGRVLRRTKVDELSQLINVVRGEMSLVGPRPEVSEIVARYTPLQRRVLSIRPGMTSPASIAYRNEEESIGSTVSSYADVILPDKLSLDLRYVFRHSFWTDLAIIARTIGVVFGSEFLLVRRLARLVRRHVPWIAIDAFVIALGFYVALLLRLLDGPPAQIVGYLGSLSASLPALMLLYAGMNSLWGLQRRVWRYATASDVRPIFGAAACATAIAFVADLSTVFTRSRLLPLSVILLGGFFSFSGMVLTRYRLRLFRGLPLRSRAMTGGTRCLIYGAGEAGQVIALRLLTGAEGQAYQLVGFIDDDPRKRDQRIHGLRVLGGRRELPDVVERKGIDLLIIAIYKVSAEAFRQILTAAQQTTAQVRVIPDVFEAVTGPNGAPLLREVRAEDLLGRQAVQLDRPSCERVLRGKVVLITGGCGSVGSELSRQVALLEPKCLVMLDNNETGLYDLELALRAQFRHLNARVIVADVTDRVRMDAVFREINPEVIFHAAAYKHVPLMECFPQEAVRVNIGGTRVVLETASRFGAEYFVLVSTDKAVDAHSVMGATKRVAEMLVIGAAKRGGNGQRNLCCTAVRFGNVLGSRGSVVPTFTKEIEAGGPVTVTHLEMTRYFMDISEAAGLIIQAASYTVGGDIFMLEMGVRIRIDDLARKMIRMRGLRPDVDIPIVYTGVRPGEKLHEDLTLADEERELTSHPSVHRLRSRSMGGLPLGLTEAVDELLQLARDGTHDEIVSRLMRLARTPFEKQPAEGIPSDPSLPSFVGRRREVQLPGVLQRD